jgi:hypothetical protein
MVRINLIIDEEYSGVKRKGVQGSGRKGGIEVEQTQKKRQSKEQQ